MSRNSISRTFMNILKGFKTIIKIPFNFIKYAFLGVKISGMFLINIITTFLVSFYNGLIVSFKIIFFLIKYILLGIGTIIITIFHIIVWILNKPVRSFLKYSGLGLKVLIKSLWKGIRFALRGLVKFIKNIGIYTTKLSVLFWHALTYLGHGLIATFYAFVSFLNYLLIGLYVSFRILIKVGEFIIKFTWWIFKKLFWVLLWPFKKVITNIKQTIKTAKENKEINAALDTQQIQSELLTTKQKKKAEKRRLKMEEAKRKKERKLYQKQLSNKENITLLERFKRFLGTLGIIKYIKEERKSDIDSLMIEFNAEDTVKRGKPVIYQYLAKNSDGQMEKGTFQAFSKLDVHSYLLSEGYEIYKIETSILISLLNKRVETKIRVKDLVFFLTQLNTYVKAGIPLVEAIKIISKQTKNKNRQNIYKAIIYELTMGESLSIAFEKQGSVFPKLLINMLKASELAGNMTETLDDMIAYFTAIDETRKQMITAMIYPATIFIFATVVVSYILMYVIPKFVDVFESLNTDLPAITVFILDVSQFLSNYWIFLLLGIIVLGITFLTLYKKSKTFRKTVQWVAMHIPVIGNVIIYNEVTVFTKTFSSLLKHNVYITDSMEILNKITNNEIYKSLILDTITNLARGEKVSTAFKDKWSFPDIAYSMLVTGERTGQLGPMMEKVSEHFEIEHRNSVARIKTLVEPILIIFLAVVVGGILLAIVIPMFSMYQNIGM